MMRMAHWIETRLGHYARVRCKYCTWEKAADTPRNAFGRWSRLRSLAWKHIQDKHPDELLPGSVVIQKQH